MPETAFWKPQNFQFSSVVIDPGLHSRATLLKAAFSAIPDKLWIKVGAQTVHIISNGGFSWLLRFNPNSVRDSALY